MKFEFYLFKNDLHGFRKSKFFEFIQNFILILIGLFFLVWVCSHIFETMNITKWDNNTYTITTLKGSNLKLTCYYNYLQEPVVIITSDNATFNDEYNSSIKVDKDIIVTARCDYTRQMNSSTAYKDYYVFIELDKDSNMWLSNNVDYEFRPEVLK